MPKSPIILLFPSLIRRDALSRYLDSFSEYGSFGSVAATDIRRSQILRKQDVGDMLVRQQIRAEYFGIVLVFCQKSSGIYHFITI